MAGQKVVARSTPREEGAAVHLISPAGFRSSSPVSPIHEESPLTSRNAPGSPLTFGHTTAPGPKKTSSKLRKMMKKVTLLFKKGCGLLPVSFQKGS
jgi:hypothetical protein